MFKHIIGQALYQLTVLLVLIFAGEYIIPEYVDKYDSTLFASNPEHKWLDGIVGGTVRSGRLKMVDGSDDYMPVYEEFQLYSRHFTFIFNAFVMMQVSNFVNCKKLHE